MIEDMPWTCPTCGVKHDLIAHPTIQVGTQLLYPQELAGRYARALDVLERIYRWGVFGNEPEHIAALLREAGHAPFTETEA